MEYGVGSRGGALGKSTTKVRGRGIFLIVVAALVAALGGWGWGWEMSRLEAARTDVGEVHSQIQPVEIGLGEGTNGGVFFYTTTLSIPTYPYADFLSSHYDPTFNITYRRLDWARYEGSHPLPTPQDYELLVLENDYLQVTLLPSLGGRIYQMIYKPTGHNVLYQNPVIKPSPWGPPEQGWWLAVGGIEWCLPVDEHGYAWGEAWDYDVVTTTSGVTVTLRDTLATDHIRAAVSVHLPAGGAYLAITPRIENPTSSAVDYKYWTNAMLAPGPSNTVGAELRLVFNAGEMSVHSTGDERLPGHHTVPEGPDYRFSWPVYQGVDFSRLGEWRKWVGFFEYPRAAGDFAGVYDVEADEGLVRVFPPDVARGSKGFGFGWAEIIDPNLWTDDGSAYFELHGGVAPTFWDWANLEAGASLSWTEIWYPVGGVGRLRVATAEAALGVREVDGAFVAGLHATEAQDAGTFYVWDHETCTGLARRPTPGLVPSEPFTASVAAAGHSLTETAFVYVDAEGEVLVSLHRQDCPAPAPAFQPLPTWTPTTSFDVTWGEGVPWRGLATYDVQVCDGVVHAYPCDGGWDDWLTDTTAISATFEGVHGRTYFFRARARDVYARQSSYVSTDNRGRPAFTTVLTEAAPVLVTSYKRAEPYLFHLGQTITYTIFLSNTGSLSATVILTDTFPPDLEPLTPTISNGLTLNYPSRTIHWAGVVSSADMLVLTYVLSPTATAPLGVPLTNAVEVVGSVSGPLTRRALVVRAYPLWLPLVLRTQAS